MSTSSPTKSNFWVTCPRKLKYYPEASCVLGKAGIEDHSSCSWFINSEQDHYCFWTWIRRTSDKNGFLEPLLQHDISLLLNTSSSKVYASYKEALEKLQEFPEFEDLIELFED